MVQETILFALAKQLQPYLLKLFVLSVAAYIFFSCVQITFKSNILEHYLF